MNDLPVTGYLCYAQRTLGSPGGKHCKSLEGNVWRKVVLTSKENDFGERSMLFRLRFIENEFGQCLYMENASFLLNNREICDEKLLITSLSSLA